MAMTGLSFVGLGYSSVAISDGRLTIRHGDALMAYDIKGK